jgi:predicted lipoprotein with Yx(FWY)xxD motif
MRLSFLAATALVIAGIAISTTAASSHPAMRTASGTVIGTKHTSLGTILVAGPKHLTVYLFEADKGSKSKCKGACARAWPPVTTTGAPRAEGRAVAGDLGTTMRAGGVKQVTYEGHPLYWYDADKRAGETTGQGSPEYGASWWVLSPSGKAITSS